MILKAILSNLIPASVLSRCLQGKNVDVINTKWNANKTIKTLRSYRDEDTFKRLWIRTNIFSDTIEDIQFAFKEEKVGPTDELRNHHHAC